MNHLGYSYLENFEDIDKLKSELEEVPKNIQKYIKEEEKVYKNKEQINNSLEDINESDKQLKKSKTKEHQDQMINDYHSVVMQQKFILGLGGITLLSLIILNSQI